MRRGWEKSGTKKLFKTFNDVNITFKLDLRRDFFLDYSHFS